MALICVYINKKYGGYTAMKKITALLLAAVCVLLPVGCSKTGDAQENHGAAEDTEGALEGIALDEPLDLDAGSGVGLEIAFESEERLIFYGEFGLFCYNLTANKMEFSVDFMKAVGIEGSVQGSYGPAVEVSEDGNTVILSEYTVETGKRGKTCFIDIPSMTYEYGEYQPLEKPFLKDSINGYIYPGVKIRQIKYVLDNEERSLFLSADPE